MKAWSVQNRPPRHLVPLAVYGWLLTNGVAGAIVAGCLMDFIGKRLRWWR